MLGKRLLLVLLCCLLGLFLSSCSSTGLPVTDGKPTVTLPPAEIHFVAPIGDAALEYTREATLYLPSHDGIGLTTVSTEVSFSPVRPDAESLVRALLNHAGTKDASSLGGSIRLSLYGTSPVEVSRNVATVHLSASALQLDREILYVACQAIANTLTELDQIDYVNVLVVNKPVGLDIANTLPMGTLTHNSAQDLGAVYEQYMSRRVDSNENAATTPLTSNVTFYLPLINTDGMVCEVRSMSFENQLVADMVVSILQEMAAGPDDSSISSPVLPLLADLLTSTPALVSSDNIAGNLISLDFASNLDDMLDAYGISRKQCMASICYTLCTFFPNVSGIQVSINGVPVDPLLLAEDDEEERGEKILLRSDFSGMLYDYCKLYFGNGDSKTLAASKRPLPYALCTSPRSLLFELSKGPQEADSVSNLLPVMKADAITDTDLLGLSLNGNTLLVNFAPSFSSVRQDMTSDEERLLAYAIVNTLCSNERMKSVCFFEAGNQFEGTPGGIYWAGLFYPLPE